MIKKSFSQNFILTLIATTLFISTYYFLLPVLPLHMQFMGGSNFKIGIIMGLFSISSLIFRPVAGQASDQQGPKKLMKLAIFLYFMTPLFYFIDSFFLLGIVQLVYGFAIGAFTISSATVITVSVPHEEVSQAIGLHSIALIIAKGLAPTLGTYFYELLGLFPLLVFTFLLAALAFFFTSRVEDIPPINKNSNVSFVQVLTYRMVWVPSLVLLTVTLTFGNIMTMLPLFAIERNITHYSWFFMINTIAVVVTRLITGQKTKLTNESLIVISLLLVFIAVFLIAGSYSITMLITAAFIYGLGYGAVYPALSTLVVLNTPQEIRGSAFGLFTAAFDIGVTLGSFWGGFSEFLDFEIIYLSTSLAPIIGLLIFIVFLHKNNSLAKIFIYQKGK